MKSKRDATLAAALSLIGIIISIYLVFYSFTGGQVLGCPSTSQINCQTVLNSQYASTFGIPNSIMGLLFFIIELVFIYKINNPELFMLYNAIGIGFVLYFLNIEYIVGAICLYCTGVHILVVLLFILSLLNLKSK